ncbi:DUF2897 family protein [Vibrio amylolyticus]|uniref:DUF2897 family protein n=1 Tax=Vibrio amylolyticus TaxID=2847292 RepID=UPI00354F8200
MDILTNPWIISLLAMGFMVSNIMALKYVAKLKIGQMKKTPKKPASEEQKTDEEVKKGVVDDIESESAERANKDSDHNVTNQIIADKVEPK